MTEDQLPKLDDPSGGDRAQLLDGKFQVSAHAWTDSAVVGTVFASASVGKHLARPRGQTECVV